MDVTARLRDRDCLYDDGAAWRRTMMLLTPVVRPVREEIGRTLVDGARRARSLYDATGIVTNNDLGSAVYGSASNPADKWFEIGTEDPEFDKWPKAKSALTTYSRRTLASYGPSWSAFYAQSFPNYLDATGLGEGYFYSAIRVDAEGSADGFTDKCIPLSEAEYRVDDEGRVTHFYRRFKITLEEAGKLAESKGGQLSDKAQRQLKDKPYDMIELQHSVYPNDKYMPDRIGPSGMKVASCYDQVDEKFEISAKGFYDMPYSVAAWERAAGERHGRGAGEMALADILSLQVMQRGNLEAGSWAANPMWGMPHDANLNITRMRPGAVVAGSFDMRGNQLLKRLAETGASTPFALDMTNQLRDAIRAAFGAAVMNLVPTNRTGLDPGEVLDLREERFRRMAPYQGSITAGFLDPHVRRRFAMLTRLGIFKDVVPPKELAGKHLQPRFTSPMAMAQAAARASSAVRAAGALAQVAELKPGVLDRFNEDAYAVTVLKGFGVSDVMNDDDVTDQNKKSRLAAQAAQQKAEMAETVAGAAQKGAGAVAALRAPRPGA